MLVQPSLGHFRSNCTRHRLQNNTQFLRQNHVYVKKNILVYASAIYIYNIYNIYIYVYTPWRFNGIFKGEVCVFSGDFSGFPKDSSETFEAKASFRAPRSLGGSSPRTWIILRGRKPTIPMVTWDPRMESLGDDPPRIGSCLNKKHQKDVPGS